jgi:NAD(P)-dependent dehydrogenase (short-subunit alcohol dehydrogenase family)
MPSRPDERPLAGRRALVTGGGANLGRQMATALAHAGAAVTICGRRSQPLDETVAELRDLGLAADAVVADVTDEPDRQALVAATGPIDILVNNAGYSKLGPWLEVSLEEWREVMTINLEAPFRLCQLYAPAMSERRWGRIINIASLYATLAGDPDRYPGQGIDIASYVTSKHGLLGLTRHLAVMLGPDRVTVNAISPGMFVLPESTLGEEARRQLELGAPLKRTGSDDDLASTVVYLAADGSSFVTGQNLVVDGGWSIW